MIEMKYTFRVNDDYGLKDVKYACSKVKNLWYDNGEWYVETKCMLSRFDNIFHKYKVSEFLDMYELKDKSNSQFKCEIDI